MEQVVIPKHIRHNIYLIMYIMYTPEVLTETTPLGLCMLLHNAKLLFAEDTKNKQANRYTYVLNTSTINDFEELSIHEPINYGLYWFDPNDRLSRIKILLQAIKDTKF